jgi:hypothetical protein
MDRRAADAGPVLRFSAGPQKKSYVPKGSVRPRRVTWVERMTKTGRTQRLGLAHPAIEILVRLA